MDDRQRLALQELVRAAVGCDLDELYTELDQLRREARSEILMLRRAVGLDTDRLSQTERRALVAQLREQGLSARRIALAAGVHRQTVERDVAALGLPAPSATLGLDGVTRRRPAVGS